ncbi:MAG: hypothetical protein JSW71_21495 [Gemmatimonadota bacterium]|nr:MAG: hypothetical protein JSW71_21495 [Gemmatimonadota bacterium]
MNTRMGLKEFFAMEASEYLDRLDVIVSAAAGPDRVELVRLARALRGSALMANEHQIGEVAAALENFARAIGENRAQWDERAKQIAVRAVDDLRILVRKVGDWSDAEDATAAAAAEQLNSAAGVTKVTMPTRQEAGIDSGTRAFVARECAIVASSLHAVAKSLHQELQQPEQLDELLKVMQPLRGLAVLPEISPIPEVLEGVERAVGIVQRGIQREGMAQLLDTAARALSNAAQEIVATGSARPDSPEAREFASRFGSMLDSSEVVPIQSLFYDDDGPHILETGTPAAVPGRLAQLELVAHGEHLKQAADELERAQWDTQRELRALALTSTFRSLLSATGGPLENALAEFARAAQNAVTRGAPLHRTREFAAYLRETGAILTSSTEGEPADLAQRLSRATTALQAIPAGATVTTDEHVQDHPSRPPAPSAEVPQPIGTEHEAAAVEEPAAAAEEAAKAEATAVPEAAAPPEPSEVAAIRDSETPDLAGGWARYERLQGQAGPGEGTLEEFLATAPPEAEPATRDAIEIPAMGVDDLAAEPEIPALEAEMPAAQPEPPEVIALPAEEPAPITASGYGDSPVAASEPQLVGEAESDEQQAATAGETTVPITDLCYRGEAAVERALQIREQIHAVLARPTQKDSHLQDLVDELLDIVELNLEQ